MATQAEIRHSITERIVAALEAGTPPWRRPWCNLSNTGSPANVVSRRSYSGVNPLLLELVAQERGYRSRWWGTFRQWTDLGFRIRPRPSHVKPGEWGTKVVFCKPVSRSPVQPQTHDAQDRQPVEPQSRILFLRQFTVFSAEQVEGEGVEKYLARPLTAAPFLDYGPAESVIVATGADIRHGGAKAFYQPDRDFIQLPPKESFVSPHEYYGTAFHELGHWTGHESRLGRGSKNSRFGDAEYAFEELVAEIAGCFVCSEVGIPHSNDLSNQAAYLASWLRVLNNDPTAIFTASSQASAAVDYLLAFSRKQQDNGIGGCGEEPLEVAG